MADHFDIDFERKSRLGFPEIIFGTTKSAEMLLEILQSYQQQGTNALITKLQEEKAKKLQQKFPQALYDGESGSFLLELDEENLTSGQVAIISAGSSDLFVVNEIYYTLAYLGLKAQRINDVGVSGVHRLMSRVEDLKKYKVLIVVECFEGALPTVVGGLLPQPIIAVPSSVGYGVASGGSVALNTMLSSCANGISVMNIANGYGAAMAAFRILNLMK